MKRIGLEDLGEMIDSGSLPAVEHCPYCDKVAYASEKDAKDAAREVWAKGKGHTWTYECPKGKGWHLTSQPRHKSDHVPKVRKQSKSYRNNGEAVSNNNYRRS